MFQTVSIIIPCKNEEQYIERCIQSIINVNFPKELLSVYVCDGMSTDNTRAIIKQIIAQYSYIELIDNPQETTPHALNIGFKKSNADVKIIVDGHCEIDADFIIENLKALAISDDIVCAGGTINSVSEDENYQAIALAMSSPFGVGDASFRTGNKNGYVDTVAFAAYKKEVFEKIGYFDEELIRNHDDDFTFRLRQAGMKVYLSDTIKSTYYVRTSIKNLFRQYYQYGYWKVYVNKKHKTITSLRQTVPLVFVLSLLILGATSFIYSLAGMLLLIEAFLYLSVGLFFAFKKTTNVKQAFQLIPIFFILHSAYGMGYLKAITDFFIIQKPIKSSEALTR
jgi:glycosyltransferase involved in cell wall biosynthesis